MKESASQRSPGSVTAQSTSHFTLLALWVHASRFTSFVRRVHVSFGLLAVTTLYLILAIAFSQVTPFNKGPDEGYHLEYITFIKQHGRLPINYEERAQITRADFPPMYQLLVALLSAKVRVDGPPYFKIFWDSFRYQAMDHQLDQVWTISTEDYQPPYLGRFLVWQIGRWVSIGLSLLTIGVVFLTLQETPLRQIPLASLTGAALLAFIPQYIFLGASLNDDNLLGLLAALYFWALVKAVKRPERWWPFVAMGILLGLSMTVKYTLVVVPLEIVVVCGLIARQSGLGRAWAWRRIGLVGGLALLCSSWWFGWSLWFLNTVQRDGWIVGLISPLLAGGSDPTMNRLGGFLSEGQVGSIGLPENIIVGTYSRWVKDIVLSFWGLKIGRSIPLFPYVYWVITLILGVAVFGLWRLWQTKATSRKWLALFIFHIGLFFILPLVRFELTRRLSVAAQGRHILIPAATAVVALLVWGLATAIPQRWQRPVFAVIIIGFIAWTGTHLYRLATFAPPPLPLRTIPQAAEQLPYAVDASFGQTMALVSYDLDPRPEQGLLDLTLAWRALAYTNESYLLRVNLVNTQDEVVSHWLGYNGQGRVPTLTWDPDDVVFDRLTLPLPNLPAGDYHVQLQVVGSTGPLPVSYQSMDQQLSQSANPHQSDQPELLPLTRIALAKPATLTLARNTGFIGQGLTSPIQVDFDLWRTDGPVSPTQFPTYRYPTTISIITSHSGLNLALIDPDGRAWPATHSQANIHAFIIGPRWPSGDYRLQMTLQETDDVVGQTVSEPLLRVENWWERHFERPDIAVPVEANFADQIKLLGYKLPQNQVKAGQAFPLTLYWQAPPNRSPQADFTQFNHLLDSTGTLRGGYDRRPLEYYSTLLWAPGEIVVDGYAVPVEADAPPGEYYLDVGYYLIVGESAVNLPLVEEGQMTEVSSVTIGPIEVVRP